MGVPRTLKQVLQTGAEFGRVRIEAPKAPRGVGWGLGRGQCPLPRKFLQFFIKKRRVLVHSDVLNVRVMRTRTQRTFTVISISLRVTTMIR